VYVCVCVVCVCACVLCVCVRMYIFMCFSSNANEYIESDPVLNRKEGDGDARVLAVRVLAGPDPKPRRCLIPMRFPS
jgi:hypothetical protein